MEFEKEKVTLKNYEKLENLPRTKDGSDVLSKSDKKDKFLLRDLAILEPARLSYDKLLSKLSLNPDFIMSVIPNNRDAIKYMDPKLKEDVEFLNLVINKYPQALEDVLKNCNVAINERGTVVLLEDKIKLEQEIFEQTKLSGKVPSTYNQSEKIMTSMIAKDAGMILLVSDELKNNKEFIKTEAMKNDEVLEKIVQNANQFGIEGLIGAKSANTEKTMDAGIEWMKSEVQRLEAQLKEFGSELSEDDVKKIERQIHKHNRRIDEWPTWTEEKKQRYMNRASNAKMNVTDEFRKKFDNNNILGNEIKNKQDREKEAENREGKDDLSDEAR